ncbi:hypothetical protein [Microbacterium rhizophilus]|uniref:hypothetical protein n=1 Tax=Microbacterium rhizophilus TaxID=3138934 RepID=UPI0031E77A39
MPLVTVTYNAWDHNREVVPASRQPRVGFRPLRTSYANGLMTNREVWGSLNATTGAGSVPLEKGVLYMPFMDWLTGEASTENDRGGYCEWKPFRAVISGAIGAQPTVSGVVNGIVFDYGPPPAGLEDVAYIDISGEKPVFWIPEGVS